MNRLRLLWSFLSMKSSFTLLMLCSPSPATIRPSSVLQKFLYCGLLKNFLNFEKMFLILRGYTRNKAKHELLYVIGSKNKC